MTDEELRRLARFIVQEQAENDRWMESFARAQARLGEQCRRLVSAKTAAEMLGISVWQLYRIKDDDNGVPRFSYTKGGSQSSPLRFNPDTIVDEYESYLAETKKNVAVMR